MGGTALAACLGLAACGGGSAAGTSPSPLAGSGELVLSASPLAVGSIVQITPLGNLNPPDHTLPTDHIYLNTRTSGPALAPQPVYAPGDGTVSFILQRGTDAKIAVQRGSTTYYLDHVMTDGTIRQGMTVAAGQQVGMTNPVSYGLDLGVMDDRHTVPFLSPARYASESLHGDAPLKYFAEPLRTQLYALVNRVGSDRDGQFNFDVAGHLAGNWFLDGLAPSDSAGPSGWTRHLAFVRDNVDPSLVRISVGGTLALTGAFGVGDGAPDPANVGPSSGVVVFRLMMGAFGQSGGSPAGVMLVQMLDASRLRAEIVPGSQAVATGFSPAAQIYVR